jgi:hypothetical protein
MCSKKSAIKNESIKRRVRRNSLPLAELAGFSQNVEQFLPRYLDIWQADGRAKPAPLAPSARFCRAPAPIPVTRLWMLCTRLKIRGLQIQIFH